MKKIIFNSFKKHKFVSILMGLTLISTVSPIFYNLHAPNKEYNRVLSFGTNQEPIGPVYQGISVQLKITNIKEKVIAMKLPIATYSRMNEGSLTIKVYNLVSKQQLESKNLNLKEITDNSWIEIPLNNMSRESELNIGIDIESDADYANAITFWGTGERNRYLKLFINNTYITNNVINVELELDR
jgi:hypothetical protein